MALPYQQTLENLQKMFQTIDSETISAILISNNGLIEPSIEHLLKLSETSNDPLADQKMTIFTMNANNSIENPKENNENSALNNISPQTNENLNSLPKEGDLNLIKQLQQQEDENIALALQNHYITKANAEALQRIYDHQEDDEYLDPKILENENSEEEEYEKKEEMPNPSSKINKKPIAEEFGPIPKPLKPQKKTFSQKFKALFSRNNKNKSNLMGKHEPNKIKEQEFGEIISFEAENNDSKKNNLKK